MTAPPRKSLRIAPVVLALSIGAGLVAGCGSSSSASEPPATSAPPVRQAAGVSEEELRRRANGAVEEFTKAQQQINGQLAEVNGRTFK